MTFLQPGWLVLLALVPVIWFWPKRFQEPWHALLRSLVLGLVIVALARPVHLTQDDIRHHVFVIDGSASVKASDLSSAREAVAKLIAGLDKGDRAHVIEVGRHAPVSGASTTRLVAGKDSPIATALALAALEIPEGSRGSVTLFSDGQATDRSWAPAVEALCARKIPLHTVTPPPRAGDVRPVAISPGGLLRVGQTARVLVDVAGTAPGVKVQLSGPDGVVAETGPFSLADRKRAVLEFEPKRAGFGSYTAKIELTSGTDRVASNNTIATLFAIQDPIRVLYLGSRVKHSEQRLRELLGRGFEIDEEPTTTAEPAAYDLVVLDDKPAKELPREFQRKLVTAVEHDGLGLCMTGGGGSFGPGGYHKTPIENILPVEFVQKEEKKDPSTALAIIIDTSGSMGGNRIVLAKEVTRLALRRLLPHDKVGIVEFYGNKRWAAPLQSAANAIDIQRALNRLDAGGGTILYPAVEEAYYGLRNVQTRYKHVLILTDAGVESGPYEQLLRRMAKDNICVSTVLVGPGRHSEFLAELADWGRGRFYHASDRFNLPEIMLKQPSSSRLPAYRTGAQAVEAQGGRGWWGDADPHAVPAVSGYVETRARPGADVVLRTRQDRHPILASWRFGLGRTTALTTEPTGPGSKPWQAWDGYGSFLARVFSRTASDGRVPFRFSLVRRDHELVLTARRLDESDRSPSAKWLDGNSPRELIFRERAPGVFEARFSCSPDVPARVVAGIAGSDAGRVRLASAALADRADELQVDPERVFDTGRAAQATGGRVVSMAGLATFAPDAGGGTRPLAVSELWPLCLLLALLFYFADLTWRRSPWRRVAE